MLSGETANLPEGFKPGGAHGSAPELLPGAVSLWEAWEALQWSRPIGQSIGAIPVSEVLAYCLLFGIEDFDQRGRILGAVQRLDAEFLKHHAEQMKKG